MKWINKFIVWIMPIFPKSFIWLFSKRYIAGKQLADGLEKTKELNANHIAVTMDVLGEDITQTQEAEAAKEEALEMLDTIHKSQVNATISVKLTQLGLKIDPDLCYKNIYSIVHKANALKNFVRIDMEDETCTSETLYIYRELRKEFDRVGTVIQAYLKRSQKDVQSLIDDGIANLRVCKGIYDESPQVAYKDKQEIRENFNTLNRMMLESKNFIGIATHDLPVVDTAKQLLQEFKVNKSDYEFQMLLGVTENLRSQLVEEGHPMRVYVPFGEQWYGYCIRRMKENPQVAGHVVKNLFIRG